MQRCRATHKAVELLPQFLLEGGMTACLLIRALQLRLRGHQAFGHELAAEIPVAPALIRVEMVLIRCLLLLYLHGLLLSYLFNKCPNFLRVLLLVGLDAAAHIDSPRAHLSDSLGCVFGCKATCQQDR